MEAGGGREGGQGEDKGRGVIETKGRVDGRSGRDGRGGQGRHLRHQITELDGVAEGGAQMRKKWRCDRWVALLCLNTIHGVSNTRKVLKFVSIYLP